MTAKDKDREQARRLADVAGVGGGAFEGESKSMKDLEGVELTILDFKFLPSQYREGENFLMIQARQEKDLVVINTGAQVVMAAFEVISKDALPLQVKFVKVEGKERSYWTME